MKITGSIFLSSPPQSPEHAFVEMMEKAQTQRNGYYLCLTIDDISDLDPAEKERLLNEVGGRDSTAAQREFYCKVIVDTNRAIAPSFSRAHVTNQEFEHVSWRLFADSGGVQDKTSFLRVGYDHDTGKVIFRDELFFDRGTNTQQIVSKVKEVYPGLGLTMDMAGQLRVDYSAMGLPATPPMKDDFEAGLLLLNSSFHNNKVLIHEDCKMLIRTLEGGLLNKAWTDYERTQALGHADAVAAPIYALRGVDKVTDLRPSKHAPGTVIWKPNCIRNQLKQDSHPLSQLTYHGSKSDW